MVSVQGVQGPSVVSHVPASLGSICWALTLHTKPTSRNNRNTYPFILALLSRGMSITTGTEAYMRWYNDCLSRVPGDWYVRFCGEGVIAISSPYPTSYKLVRRLLPNAATVGDCAGHRSTKDPHRQGSAPPSRLKVYRTGNVCGGRASRAISPYAALRLVVLRGCFLWAVAEQDLCQPVCSAWIGDKQ